MSDVNKQNARQRIADKINAAKVATRLQAFALSKSTDKDYKDNQMSGAQVNAAKTLLSKVVPDLKQVEQTIRDERKKTRQEIEDALRAKGIDPELVWGEVVKH